MREIGRGAKVFDHDPVRGRLRHLDGPDDVLALLDSGAGGIVALVRDAGATFLAPLFHELSAVVCTSGTPRSHIVIVSPEFRVPCVTAAVFDGVEPDSGAEIEVDGTGRDGIIRG